jgi:hypothetical protein
VDGASEMGTMVEMDEMVAIGIKVHKYENLNLLTYQLLNMK